MQAKTAEHTKGAERKLKRQNASYNSRARAKMAERQLNQQNSLEAPPGLEAPLGLEDSLGLEAL